MMETHEIISVKIVTGQSLNPKWHNNMQVIETNKGTYIDNIESVPSYLTPGYSWTFFVGQSVSGITVNTSSGFNWLNKSDKC
jgi:hypothetical protein